MNSYSVFTDILDKWNIPWDDEKIVQLDKYYEMLIEKNKVMNLTAITEFEDVLYKHFLDSLTLLRYENIAGKSVIDVGTGAGFPGMVLKIFCPEIKLTLADSLNKRLVFLNEVIDELGLSDVATVHGRAEDLARNNDFRDSFDYCVSRAVANLPVLLEYSLPFVKVGGHFIAYKAETADSEIGISGNALKKLEGSIDRTESFIIDNTDYGRTLIFVKKNKKTPKSYPRKASVPTKNPL